MSIAALWDRLALARRFETRSRSEQGGCEAAIIGAVTAERDGAALRFTERGVATMPDGRRYDTRNAIVWTRDGGVIDLAHERLGAAHAVGLVRLRAIDDAMFASESAHVCGEDRYECVVRLREDAIEVAWTITGPRKCAVVTTAYS